MASLIFSILALLLAVHTAYGLRCYMCNSNDNVACRWGLTSFTYDTQECASAGILDSFLGAKCYKITAETKDGRDYVARGCLPPGTVGCKAIASAIGWFSSQSNDADSLRYLNCDTCDSDRCNSAQKVTEVTYIALILVGVAVLF